MSATGPTVLVCDDPSELPAAGRVLAGAGWVVRMGFDLPAEPWDLTARRWACQGTVTGAAGADAALWALVRGCGLSVVVDPGVSPDLLGDLARAGQLTRFGWRRGAQSALGADESDLLAALAAGLSMKQAATRLHLSGRTAQRRLAAARVELGVRSTREAVVAWTRLDGGSTGPRT